MQFQKQSEKRRNEAKAIGGVFLIAFGVLFLMARMGVDIPRWVFSWKLILIAIGFVSLYRHYFRNTGGWVMVGIGTFFLLSDLQNIHLDTKILLPIVVIIFGVVMVARAANIIKPFQKKNHVIFDEEVDLSSEDFIKSTTVFGGTTKNVITKDFQGGQFKTVFGGTEVNLSKADIQHPVVIDTNSMFSGVVFIVPSSWKINTEITTVLGSVEDKRGISPDIEGDPSKTLTITGKCVFGSVEIQSYI